MREIKKIIIHCSASDLDHQDSAKAIHELHTSSKEVKIQWGIYDTHGKAFSDIGYHDIITQDGVIHSGRPVNKIGAHCYGKNLDSLGICLTGVKRFTIEQIKSLIEIIKDYMFEYNILSGNVFGHYEFDTRKTCPNMDMNFIRKILA